MNTNDDEIRNCHTCKYLLKKKGEKYFCRFKKIMMGTDPHYIICIPPNHLKDEKGKVICKWTPRKKQKGINEYF